MTNEKGKSSIFSVKRISRTQGQTVLHALHEESLLLQKVDLGRYT